MVSTNDEKLIKNQKISEILSGLLAAKSKADTAEILQEKPRFIRDFFNEPYFRGSESLIEKLLEKDSNLKIDSLLEESFNLGGIYSDCSKLWDLKLRLADCEPDFIKSIAENIHAKVEEALKITTTGGTLALPDCYKDSSGNFSCKPAPNPISADKCIGYIQEIADYLTDKEGESHAKKASEVLGNLTISNDDINNKLSSKVVSGTYIRNFSDKIKKSFDILLKYEIGQNVDAFIDYSEKATNLVANLFSNALPGINTLITNSGYKYDESTFQEYEKDNIKAIVGDKSTTAREKENQIAVLRRIYYIADIKSKNPILGNTLEKLYENDFDYSKLENTELQAYLSEITKTNLNSMIKNDFLRSAFHINFGDDLSEFEDFYKELGDITKDNIILDKNLGITLPVEKCIIPGKHTRLNNIRDAFGDNPKPWDSLPIKYTIKKEEIEKLKIGVEDMTNLLTFLSQVANPDNPNEYIFQGEDVGKLIFLFFIINSKHPLTSLNLDKQKEIEKNIFGEKGEGEYRNEDLDRTRSALKDPTDTPEIFKSEIEKFGKDGSFKNGAEIWMPIGDSILPGGGQSWFKIKVSDIDMNKGTFKGTGIGGDLDYKGKNVSTFDMNKATLERFQNGAKGGKVLLLPDPSEADFSAYLNSLNNKLGTENLTFPPEGVKWDGNKFTHKVKDEKGNEKEEEVKNFGINDGDNLCTYKIKYQPGKKTFLVSGNFDGKGQNEKDKDKLFHYSYKREMDWNNFLIFMNEKKLKPQNKKEIEAVTQKQNEKTAKEFKIVNGSKLKLNWFSINSFKTAFKDITKKINGQLDAYNKAQADKLEDILIDDWGLYEKLGNILGFIPSMNEAFGNLQQEHYNKIVNGNWAHIEYYLKKFQEDEQFGDTFTTLPPHIKTKNGKSLQKWIESRFEQKYVKLEGSEEVWQTAALCLANLKQGGALYRGLTKYENQGLWVKVLLGSDHRKDFKYRRTAYVKALEKAQQDGNSNEEKRIQGILSTLEIDYICNNINGSNNALPEGSKQDRGLPNTGKENDYIPNAAKIILSEKFSKELSAAKTRLTNSAVEDEYKKAKDKHSNFVQAKEDVNRLMKSSRHPGGIGNFLLMLDLARTSSEINDCKKYFLLYMLSGVLDKYGNKKLRQQAYDRARTWGFAPGMLAKDSFHSEGVAELLQDFCPDFKSSVKNYFHKKDFLPEDETIENIPFNQLLEQFNKWREKDPERDEKFDKYLHIEFPTKDFSDKPLLQNLQKKLNENRSDDINSIVLGNSSLMEDSRLLAPPSAVQKMLRFDNSGRFEGEGTEPDDKADFWKACTKDIKFMINNRGFESTKTVNWMIDKYFGWFKSDSIEDRQELLKYINTAEYYQNKIKTVSNPYIPCQKKCKINIKGRGRVEMDIPLGKVGKNDIDKILLYGFEGSVWSSGLGGKILPPALKATLDTFQDFFDKAFEAKTLYSDDVKNKLCFNNKNDDRFLLCGWDAYNITRAKANEWSNSDEDEVEGTDFERLSEKEKKKILTPILRGYDSEYINNNMESIESRLKRSNTLSPEWRLTNDLEKKLSDLQDDY